MYIIKGVPPQCRHVIKVTVTAQWRLLNQVSNFGT